MQQPLAANPTNSVLSCRGIYKRFGKQQVLNNLAFTALRGDRIALLGANGAGKSTLLRVLAKLVRPDRGSISFLPDLQKKLGFFSQSTLLYHELSVVENLKLFSELTGSTPNVSSVCEEWEISRFRHMRVKELSKGTQARVSLARLFLGDSEIFLLDEPTASLDDRGVGLLLARLSRLKADRVGVIATHDVARLRSVFNRAVVIENGTLFADSAQPQSSVATVLDLYQRRMR